MKIGLHVKRFLTVFGAARGMTAVFTGYIGPGTGSLIIQVVLASLLGAAVAIRVYWSKIKHFFSKKPDEPGLEPEEENE